MKTESAPDLIRQFFLEEHPNPDRVGCPSEDTVRSAAEDRLPGDDPARLHFAGCSECFAEYRGYRLDWERRRAVWRRTVGWAVAAGLLICVGGGALIFRHRFNFKPNVEQVAYNNTPAVAGKTNPPPTDSSRAKEQTPPSSPPSQVDKPEVPKPPAPTGPEPLQPSFGKDAISTVLDLAPGDPAQQQRKRLLRLKAAELKLSVLLPPSSGTGKYKLQLTQDVEGQKVVASSSGQALKRDGRVRLRVHLPLTAVAPGDYFLSVVPQANASQNNSGQNNSGQNNAGQSNHQQSQALYDVQVVPR